MKYKIYCVFVVFLVVAWGSLACWGFDSHNGSNSNSIRFAVFANYKLDIGSAEHGHMVYHPFFSCIHSTLFKLDHMLKPSPFLIEKYEKKGKTVVFHIKNNACFSDGSPITAEDVIESIECEISETSFPNPIHKVIEGGVDRYLKKTHHCTGLKLIDAKTFEISFINEHIDFESYFASHRLAIVPKNPSLRNTVYSGPFQVVERNEKRDVTVVKLKQNPWYIGKKNNIDFIYFNFYSDQEDFDRAIYRGEPDIFLNYLSPELPVSTFRYNYFKTPLFGAFYIQLNPKRGPFKDKNFRMFFRNFILSLKLAGSKGWELATHPKLILPYGLTGYSLFDPIVPREVNALVFPKTIKIKCENVDTGFRKDLFTLLKKKLKNHNIELELDWKPLEEVQESGRKGEIDLTSGYFLVDTPLSLCFYETLYTPGQELNTFGYAVPEAIQLLENYLIEPDEIKQVKILSRLEKIAQDESFVIPILNPLCTLGYKNYLKNVRVDRLLGINFEELDVEKRH